MQQLLPAVVELAYQAGEQIMQIYASDFSVEDKADQSPLTAADLASHRAITAGLTALTPTIPILSEESASVSFAERQRWQRYWLVDPLDGTKEFIKRNGEFTVNIALIDNHRAVLGVVLLPARQHCYFAVTEAEFTETGITGAWRQDQADATPQPIKVQQPPTSPLRIVGSRSHSNQALTDFVNNIGQAWGEHEFIAVGSAIKFCLVAEGTADIYPRLGLTSEWDTAAAQCVVEAAGGKVITLDGNVLAYNQKDSLLNPHFLVLADDQHDWLRYLP